MKTLIVVCVAALAIVGQAGAEVPPDFLRAETKVWTAWMETVVDVQLKDVRISELSTVAPFERMNMGFACKDGNPDFRVSLDVKHVTRREALWLLAAKYGLSMKVGRVEGKPVCVQITKP
jgi:hypothetical protein